MCRNVIDNLVSERKKSKFMCVFVVAMVVVSCCQRRLLERAALTSISTSFTSPRMCTVSSFTEHVAANTLCSFCEVAKFVFSLG